MENITAKIWLESQPTVIGQRLRTYINLKLAAMGCPPLRALLEIMRDGHFEVRGLNAPAVRDLLDPGKELTSDWYRARLESKAAGDQELWSRHVKNLEASMCRPVNEKTSERLGLLARLDAAREQLRETHSGYIESLRGTTRTQPLPV